MEIDVRRVPNTPYKVVLSNWNIVGIFERRDHKEIYIDSAHFSVAHKKAADILHARTLPERLKDAKI